MLLASCLPIVFESVTANPLRGPVNEVRFGIAANLATAKVLSKGFRSQPHEGPVGEIEKLSRPTQSRVPLTKFGVLSQPNQGSCSEWIFCRRRRPVR